MGRPGVGKEDVEAAYYEIRNMGEKPSLIRIRKFTGGSFSTIKQHLDVIVAEAEAKGTGVEAIHPKLKTVIVDLYKDLQILATEAIKKREDACDEVMLNATLALELEAKSHVATKQKLADDEAEIISLRTQFDVLQKNYDEQQSFIVVISLALQTLQEKYDQQLVRITELSNVESHLKLQYEHFQNAYVEARAQDLQTARDISDLYGEQVSKLFRDNKECQEHILVLSRENEQLGTTIFFLKEEIKKQEGIIKSLQ